MAPKQSLSQCDQSNAMENIRSIVNNKVKWSIDRTRSRRSRQDCESACNLEEYGNNRPKRFGKLVLIDLLSLLQNGYHIS
ncbi:hypothetical protein BLOT_007729 [Blomia tropicalis]|nr:hypothetical protein BLOT_007729 [Blomia tropicalis]